MSASASRRKGNTDRSLAPKCLGKRPWNEPSLGAILARACSEMSRRDNAIVAWHEVPGKAHPKEPSRRVRYDRAQSGDGSQRFGLRIIESFNEPIRHLRLCHPIPWTTFRVKKCTFLKLNLWLPSSTRKRMACGAWLESLRSKHDDTDNKTRILVAVSRYGLGPGLVFGRNSTCFEPMD